MKKIIPFIFLFLFHLISFSQDEKTFTKLSEKACDCLSESTIESFEDVEEAIQNCMVEATLDRYDGKMPEQMSTVSGLKAFYRTLKTKMLRECSVIQDIMAIKSDAVAEYGPSENQEANKLYARGSQFLKEGKTKKAIFTFEKALELDSTFVVAIDNIGIAYRLQNDLENALKYYQKSLKIYPSGNFALNNSGVVYIMQEDWEKAENIYLRFQAFYPGEAEGYYGISRVYLMTSEWENALHNILKAHRIYLDENNPYVSDSSQIIQLIYDNMVKEDMENEFKEIMAEYNFDVNFN